MTRYSSRKPITGKNLDFNSLYRLLDKHGLSMTDAQDVVGRDSQTGVRCLIERLYNSRQQEAFKSVSKELAQYDNVIVNEKGAQYRYAPEIIHPVIIVLDTAHLKEEE